MVSVLPTMSVRRVGRYFSTLLGGGGGLVGWVGWEEGAWGLWIGREGREEEELKRRCSCAYHGNS